MSKFEYINKSKFNPVTKEDIRSKMVAMLREWKEQGFTIIGLEMTDPDLAAFCDKNIDPQHTDGDSNKCCAKLIAEKAPELLGWFKSKDPDKVIFVTDRFDVDSVAAFVLADRYLRGKKIGLNENIEAINAHDTAAKEPWQGPKADRIEEAVETAFDPNSKTGALASSIKVFELTDTNITDVKNFIDTGNVDEAVMARFRKLQQMVIDKVKSKEIITEPHTGYIYVNSKEKAATDVGYSMAPVVVAENPVMPTKDGYTYRKISICQHFEGGYIDLTKAFFELNKKEIDEKIKAGLLSADCVDAKKAEIKESRPNLSEEKVLTETYKSLGGWGGSPTFLGSPNGQDSLVNTSEIKQTVFACLTPEYKAKVTASHGKSNGGKGE